MCSLPGTHMVARNCFYLQFPGIQCLLWSPWVPRIHVMHIHTFMQNTYMHKMKPDKSLRIQAALLTESLGEIISSEGSNSLSNEGWWTESCLTTVLPGRFCEEVEMVPSNAGHHHHHHYTIVLSRDRPQGHKTGLDAAGSANAYSTVGRTGGKLKARGYRSLSRKTSLGLNWGSFGALASECECIFKS